MKVGNLSTVKLTKRGDTLKGTVERVQSFVRKHNSISFTVVLLAGTNDLKRSDVSPSSLTNYLDILILSRTLATLTIFLSVKFHHAWTAPRLTIR